MKTFDTLLNKFLWLMKYKFEKNMKPTPNDTHKLVIFSNLSILWLHRMARSWFYNIQSTNTFNFVSRI